MSSRADRSPANRPDARRLPCPTVRFEPGFAARLERLALRVRAARGAREGSGAAALAGRGYEFAGYRAYTPGDDLRQLDWDLYARFDRPYVRVARRASGERWVVWIDTSASMGAGPPGKLALAAQVAAALASVALVLGGEAHVVTSARALRVRRASDLRALLGFLEGLHAHGSLLPSDALVERRAWGDAERVFVLSDLGGFAPRDVLPLARAQRSLAVLQVLAPHELAPAPVGATTWWDPESDHEVATLVDASAVSRYGRLLAAQHELWQRACARRRAVFTCCASDVAFEAPLAALVAR